MTKKGSYWCIIHKNILPVAKEASRAADTIHVKENVMKITQKGPADADLTKLVKKDKVAGPGRGNADTKTQQSGESATVNISAEARHLQRVAELARAGDNLRAEKVKNIKEKINQGTYEADSTDVSKSVVRSEIARLLEKK